jgi:hypothetical protein
MDHTQVNEDETQQGWNGMMVKIANKRDSGNKNSQPASPCIDEGQGERPLGVGLQPRQDDQEDEGVEEQADRQCIRTDPDGPLSEALTGRNQEEDESEQHR